MATKRSSHTLLLRPTAAAVAELAELRNAATGGSPVADPNLLMTFCWFGYEPAHGEPRLAAIASALDRLQAPPVRVLLDELVAGEASLLVRSAEAAPTLAALHRTVLARLAIAGVAPPRRWRFDPHVTLRRGTGTVAPALPFPIAWTSDAVHLVRSEPWHRRHVTLATWRLARR